LNAEVPIEADEAEVVDGGCAAENIKRYENIAPAAAQGPRALVQFAPNLQRQYRNCQNNVGQG